MLSVSVAVASNYELVIYFSKKCNSKQHKVKHKEVFKFIMDIYSQKTLSTLIKTFLQSPFKALALPPSFN